MDFIDYVKSLPDDHDILSDYTIRMTLSGYSYVIEPDLNSITSASLTARLFTPDNNFNNHLIAAYKACRKLINGGEVNAIKIVQNCLNGSLVHFAINQPSKSPVRRLFTSRDYMNREMRAFEMRLVKTCVAIGEANKWDEVEALLAADNT